MKKVTILMVAAVMLFAVMSFGALSLTGGGAVDITYTSSPTSFAVNPSASLQISASGAGFSYTAEFSDGSIDSFYFTIPLMKDLSLVAGKKGGFGAASGNVSVGGKGTDNYLGAQYTSEAFNAYVQSTFTSNTANVDVYANGTVGPAGVCFGAEDNFATLSGGVNVTAGPANVFGKLVYDANSASVTDYTVGANAAFGKNSLSAEYSNGNNVTAWFDTTIGSYSVELGTTLNNFAFDSAWAKVTGTLMGNVDAGANLNYSSNGSWSADANATWTPVGNVSAKLDLNYSSSSVFSSTLEMSTSF